MARRYAQTDHHPHHWQQHSLLTYPDEMAGRHSIAQIEAALRKAAGRPAVAARLLGISRQAMHERITRTPHLAELLFEIEEELVDAAESVVRRALDAGDKKMTMWVLDRCGRHRGWGRPSGPPTVMISDEEAEQLVVALGGDVELYRKRIRELRDPLSDFS